MSIVLLKIDMDPNGKLKIVKKVELLFIYIIIWYFNIQKKKIKIISIIPKMTKLYNIWYLIFGVTQKL